jgi:hypothetical protein
MPSVERESNGFILASSPSLMTPEEAKKFSTKIWNAADEDPNRGIPVEPNPPIKRLKPKSRWKPFLSVGVVVIGLFACINWVADAFHSDGYRNDWRQEVLDDIIENCTDRCMPNAVDESWLIHLTNSGRPWDYKNDRCVCDVTRIHPHEYPVTFSTKGKEQ